MTPEQVDMVARVVAKALSDLTTTWSTELPHVSGHWWHRSGAGGIPRVVLVLSDTAQCEQWQAFTGPARGGKMTLKDTSELWPSQQWAGPIAAPKG